MRESPAPQRSIFALTMTSQTFIFHKYVILSVPKMELIIDKLISFMVNAKKLNLIENHFKQSCPMFQIK